MYLFISGFIKSAFTLFFLSNKLFLNRWRYFFQHALRNYDTVILYTQMKQKRTSSVPDLNLFNFMGKKVSYKIVCVFPFWRANLPSESFSFVIKLCLDIFTCSFVSVFLFHFMISIKSLNFS